MKCEDRPCDHTPDGVILGHIELWKTEEGYTAISFVRGRVLPEILVEDDRPDDPLMMAGEMLAAEMEELSA